MTEEKPENKSPDKQTEKKPKRPPNPERKARSKHANKIARKLKEKSFIYRKRVSKLIYICCHDFADEMLRQTREIEANGGMLVNDGSRRRTPGGVFMKLAKDPMTREQRQHFLYNRRPKAEREQAKAEREKAQADATPPDKPADVPPVTQTTDEEADATPDPVPDETAPTHPPLETLPAAVQAKLKPLYAAHDKFQKRVADLEASGTTGGLQAARLMVEATRQKIDAVLAQHTDT